MTMDVYIVMSRYESDRDFLLNAVFTSRELAHQYIDKHNGKQYGKPCEYYVDGYFVVDPPYLRV